MVLPIDEKGTRDDERTRTALDALFATKHDEVRSAAVERAQVAIMVAIMVTLVVKMNLRRRRFDTPRATAETDVDA